VEQDDCALCGNGPAPHTVKLAGMNIFVQICQDCHESLLLDEFAYYQLAVVKDEEVLFEIIP
jgi:hypothetical protein